MDHLYINVSGADTYSILGSVVKQRRDIMLRKVLEGDKDGGIAAVRKAIDFYNSCIEFGAFIGPLLEVINNVSGMFLRNFKCNLRGSLIFTVPKFALQSDRDSFLSKIINGQ